MIYDYIFTLFRESEWYGESTGLSQVVLEMVSARTQMLPEAKNIVFMEISLFD